jgi:hypothetical protein
LTTPDGTTVSWSYSWTAHGYPSTTIETRSVDDSGNIETPSDAITVQITCPCSLWGTNTNPATVPFGQPDSGDGNAVEVAVAFTGSVDSEVTGLRFYKASANTGTHVGSLWTSNGTLLAQATFTNETSSGWQSVNFSSPVTIQAGQTYVVGYFAPNGHYSVTNGWFYRAPAPTPLGGATDASGPWRALVNSGSVQNGFYSYTASSAFPTSSFGASNYWVDPVLQPLSAPGQVTGVSATAGIGSATVSWAAPSSGGPATEYTITPYIGSAAQPSTTVTGGPAPTTARVSGLTPNTSYTFTVQASNTSGQGAVSAPSNSVTIQQLSAPGAPTAVTAALGSSEAMVSWTAPSNGGSPITSYTITPYVGSTPQPQTTVNNGSAMSATVTGLTNGTSYTFTVVATNSVGTGTASNASNAVTPEDTLFDFATPTTTDSGDGSAVNVGVQFTASTSGSIVGIRFYKAAANSGTHVGSLWSSTGTLLARGTFAGESASGWQTLIFSSPVSITAGTTYVASYFAPNGHYALSGNAFASAVTNGPLTAPASGSLTPGNGLYGYASASSFPNNTYNASNYWVDALFQPGGQSNNPTAPQAPTGVTASPASSQAQVSWTAPANGGSGITSYTITPYIGSTAQSPTTVNNGSATSAAVTGLTTGTSYTFTVAATNSVGTGAPSSASNAATPEDTLFDFATSPATVDSGDGNSANLGIQFTAASSGTVNGIRFYKATTNTGTHVGSLWSSTGTLLAQGTFTAETASGWQTLIFSNPVSITAATTYVASYFAPGGHYSDSAQGLANATTNGPLSAPASGSVTHGNGLYGYGSTSGLPTSSYSASNYFVDVLFQPVVATAPAAPTNVAATPGSSQALISWTPPAANGSAITSYTITPYIGSTAQSPTTVNNGSATSAAVTGLTNGKAYTFTVAATNSVGTGSASSASGAVTAADTILDFATPATIDSGDRSALELGVKFTTDTYGLVTGIRFYKAAANTGTHVGSLWSSSGTLLAQGTFSGESASGWQTLLFSSPAAISPGQTYIAGYFAPRSHYSESASGFSSGIDNPPLHAVANSTAANGLYRYGSSSTFPTQSFNATNYFVDVLFQPTAASAPAAPTNVAGIPATGQALVSWTPPAANGSAITSYTITPYIGSTPQPSTTVNSGSATWATVTGLTSGTAYTFTVAATNSLGTGGASAASAAVTPEDTIFDFGTPATIDSGDTSGTQVGVKFTADTNGSITGIRFYKASANTGSHVGKLWTATGTLLASATSTGETASGWQTILFSQPLPITAGTTYVASYFAPKGHYSVTPSGLSSGTNNPPLHAVANSTSANGVYAYGSASSFPTSSYNSTNYWVDVLFAPS